MKNTSLNSKLLTVGTVAFDSIETPFQKSENLLGGSATHFSFASSRFAPTSVVGIVGEDFEHLDSFEKIGVDTSGIIKAKGKSFHWACRYSYDLNSRETLKTELGVLADFKPLLSEANKKADYVFLGNFHPKLQLDVLSQVKKPKFVGLDTMNYWMESALPDLKKVLKKVDILIINDSEARQLSGHHNLVKGAKKILGMIGGSKQHTVNSKQAQILKPSHPATLIIKQGEHGLLMFRYDSNSKLLLYNLPGFPLEDVVDPTGAGDTFAGGFFGYLAQSDDVSWENLKTACLYGSVMASFCVEKMGTKRVQEIGIIDIKNRLKEFREVVSS